MRRKYSTLTLVILLSHLIYFGYNFYQQRHYILPKLLSGDGETRLATGVPLPISSTDIYELNLIKGISDRLAEAIIQNRASLFELAKDLPSGKKYRALASVKGIADKNSRKFGEYIDLSK